MAELKPCPFCGREGKISFKDKYWGGWNGKGDHRKAYRVQVICKSCYGRGKPILTDWLVNPNPYLSIWSGRYTADELENPAIKKHTEMFRPYVEQAIEAWNRRAESEELAFTRQFIHEHGLDFALASAWEKEKKDGK